MACPFSCCGCPVEREAAELDIDARQRLRQAKARPILERLHAWLLTRRTQVPNGSGIARAIDYSLKRWAALTHYVGDDRVPIDNNWIESQIRPIALGRTGCSRGACGRASARLPS
ncbi:protein of unknown function [Thauera humireducens]|nr:protein of unknown function [Thauera humireducens]